MPFRSAPRRCLAFLVVVIAAAVGCGGDDAVVVDLDLEFRGPDDGPGSQTLGFPESVDIDVELIRVTAFEGNSVVEQSEFPWAARTGRLPVLKFGRETWLALEGGRVGATGEFEVLASGATPPFTLSRDDGAQRMTILTTLPSVFQPAYWYDSDAGESKRVVYDLPDQHRAGHTITEIADGSGYVIIGGAKMTEGDGISGTGISSLIDTIEFYDATTGQMLVVLQTGCTASLSECALRLPTGTAFHTATALDDGRVFIMGGLQVISAAGATSLQPTRDAYELVLTGQGFGEIVAVQHAGGTAGARAFHTATRMTDGRIVILGGIGGSYSPNPTYPNAIDEVLPEPTLMVVPSGVNLSQPRALHTANFFSRGGRGETADEHGIIVVGGVNAQGLVTSSEVVFALGTTVADFLDVEPFTATNTQRDLQVPRFGHSAVSFSCPDTDVEYLAVVGGYTEVGQSTLLGSSPTATVEIYRPDDRFGSVGMYAFSENTAQLANGGRAFGSAVALPLSGEVVFMGGLNADGESTRVADRLINSWAPCDGFEEQRSIAGGMGSPRAFAAATMLRNGLVFATGGFDGSVSLESSEFYNPGDFALPTDYPNFFQ